MDSLTYFFRGLKGRYFQLGLWCYFRAIFSSKIPLFSCMNEQLPFFCAREIFSSVCCC